MGPSINSRFKLHENYSEEVVRARISEPERAWCHHPAGMVASEGETEVERLAGSARAVPAGKST